MLSEHLNLIGGEQRPATSGKWLESVNPATGDVWSRVPLSDADDVNAAVAAAVAAQPAWAALSSGVRGTYLERAAQVFADHGEELARLETTDNGNLFEVAKAINAMAMPPTWTRAGNDALLAASGQSSVLDDNTLGFTRREPYGVIGAIIPFNMPVGMFGVKASAALAGGNTVVAKPPEQASAGMLRLGQLLAEVLPPGVVNIVSGLGDVGDAIVRHRDVAKVTMTGSSSTARLIQAAAADDPDSEHLRVGWQVPEHRLRRRRSRCCCVRPHHPLGVQLQCRSGVRGRHPDARAAPDPRRDDRPHPDDRRVHGDR